MKIMADLGAVNLGMDENEADIAEELQDFDESFDTRSEASAGTSDSEPSISSVSPSSINMEQQRKHKSKAKNIKVNEKHKKSTTGTKRPSQNGKIASGSSKKKRTSERASSSTNKTTAITTSTTVVAPSAPKSSSKSLEGTKKSCSDNATAKKSRKKANNSGVLAAGNNSSNGSSTVGGETIVSSNGGESGVKDKLHEITQAKSSTTKSDESEAEDRIVVAPPPPSFESDSESVDSDAAANVKRNGRKAISKSISPEKKMSSSGGHSGGGSKSKSYDYMTKLNYLFRDTRFFLIKSNNADNIALSKSKNVWATLPQNDANLNQAFKEARNVLLIFSVNESGKFAGFARMSAPSSKDIPQMAWVLPPSISPKALGGVIQLDWICRKELSFNCTSHLYNSWNEGKPVKIGRDGQEIEPKVGAELCRLFPEDEKIELTPILRKSKETAKMMRERGIRVVYKAPRSLSSRGSRGGGTGGYRNGGGGSSNTGSGGPIRHKRTFGSAPHRPYKIPPMGPPPSSFKRGSSPYRIGNGGPGIGSSRSGGGDSMLPPWERYINSAAAEAYVADYMRTMHGQLPPLPFVPFGQMPLPTGSAGGPGMTQPGATPYEQLPPPVRYYDGPPLPDYPPPQTIRPPPPGYDKPPSYEDFAAWKNAGLPTVPPPGFPSGLSTSNGSGSGTAGSGSGSGNFSHGGSGGGGGGSVGGANSSYRNNRDANSNMNRSRERAGGLGGREYRGGGGGERERHFRGSERGGSGHRTYRDSRR